MRISKLERSPSLRFLRMVASNLLEGASISEFRETLPNGFPKIVWAVCMLMMYLTSFVVTPTSGQEALPRRQPRASAAWGAFRAFRLTSELTPPTGAQNAAAPAELTP